MPGNILAADTYFPDLEKGGSTEEKLKVMQDYLYILLEQLRYMLNNLGQENFNDAELEILSKTLTKPVMVTVKDIEGNVAQIQLAADRISSRVEDVAGAVSNISQRADSLEANFAQGGLVTVIKANIDGLGIVREDNASSLSGVALFFYDGSNRKTSDGLGFVSGNGNIVGRVQVDTSETNEANEAKYRLFVGTGKGYGPNGVEQDAVSYSLKLKSQGNSSYSSVDGNIYIQPGINKGKIVQIHNGLDPKEDKNWYKFKPTGLEHQGVKIGHSEAAIKGWILAAVNKLASQNGLTAITKGDLGW